MGRKQVRILMKTLRQEGEQCEKTEYEYTGYWMMVGEKYCLTYEEVLEETQKKQRGMRTLITYSNDSLALKRRGVFSQQMEFLPGSRTKALYEVPAGRLPMEVETQRIRMETVKEKHRILLDYRLISSGTNIGEYRMELEILF